MSKARIAINGFGRTGRCLARQIYNSSALDLVAINSRSLLNPYLLTYDSVYGRFDASVKLEEKIKAAGKKTIKEMFLTIDKHSVPVYQGDEPIAAPWAELDIDIVVDATGNFPTIKEISDHLEAGAKYVVMTYPPKDKDIKTIMVGVNEELYALPKEDKDITNMIISAGSCTALALAPVLKYLDVQYGVNDAHVLVTHCYTDSQNLLDNSNKDAWRARAAPLNIIPTTTGAQDNVIAVLPTLEGKITCMANRVPVACGSQLFIVAEVTKDASAKEINDYFTFLTQKQAGDVLGICTEPVCSSYFRGDTHNAVIDPTWTAVHDKRVRMVAWFDNEWGYTSRLIALLEHIAKKKKKWF